MNKLFVALLLIVPNYIFAQNTLQFFEEKIDFTLGKEKFTVNGVYYFSNNTMNEVEQLIMFPFSKESELLAIKRVFNLTYVNNINYKMLNKAITFKINVLPKDTVRVNVVYSQKTEKENIYILESTQTWGRALKRANYSLTVDKSIKIKNLSLMPDSIVNNRYYWNKEDFFPSENFKITIQ